MHMPTSSGARTRDAPPSAPRHAVTEALTADQALAIFAELYRGKHRLPSQMRDDGDGVFSVAHYGDISTFDHDDLTRLVLLAHKHCVRAWISASGPKRIRVWMQQRAPSSTDISHGHPTIEQAVAKFQQDDEGRWGPWHKGRVG